MKLISSERVWNKRKKAAALLLVCMMLVLLAACGKNETSPELVTPLSVSDSVETPTADITAESDTEQEVTASTDTGETTATTSEETTQEGETMVLSINGESVSVAWEDNESVTALKELISVEPLTIQMSMYGGFEQVGSIGTSLPRDDKQTTTSAGDIVLYSGNQIVVFYGSNSWAYTRLGRVTDKTDGEMAELLSNGDVAITISIE